MSRERLPAERDLQQRVAESIPQQLRGILKQSSQLQRAYLVGGCVRDALLGIPNKDFDIEVFGIDYEQLVAALSRWGRTNLVGRSFGVAKVRVDEYTFDFTLPRRDSKIAPGHKGFEIHFDPAISPKEAASRRDFTINSLMYDPRSGQILDFFGGIADLGQKILRHTSDAFPEDPLRVLRGMQFAARYELRPAAETVELSRRIKGSYSELAVERVREEWFKWAEKSVVPSRGLQFLLDTEWIDHFPELKAMRGTPQDPEWHPEGDVFTHTSHCCDALVKLPEWQKADRESRIVYALAVLLHDTAKPMTTHEKLKDGQVRIVSPGHEKEGGPVAAAFLDRIACPTDIRQRVIPLIENHMAHLRPVTDRAVRRLARRLQPETIPGLCVLMTADSMGRPPRPAVVPQIVRDLLTKATELRVKDGAPEPILLGRHLIELGLTPGPQFGAILDEAYESQLEGHFGDHSGALRWLKQQTKVPLPDEIKEKLKDIAPG